MRRGISCPGSVGKPARNAAAADSEPHVSVRRGKNEVHAVLADLGRHVQDPPRPPVVARGSVLRADP